MADKTFIAGSVDWSAGASWGGVAPVNGDNIFILDGDQTVTTNLTGLAAVSPARVVIGPGFKGNLGYNGSPVTLTNISTRLEFDGGGGQHFINPSGTVAEAIVYSTGGGKLWLGNGTWSDLAILNGEVEAGASAVVTLARAIAGQFIARSATAGTTLHIKRGFVDTYRTWASVYLQGNGALNLFDAAAVSTVLRMAAGFVRANATGTIAKLEAFAGTVSARGNRNGFAITNADLYGPELLLDDPSQKITWSNTPKRYNFSGGNVF